MPVAAISGMTLFPAGRSIRTVVATAALCFGAFGGAEASPISFDYTFNPTDVYIDNQGTPGCTGDTVTQTVTGTNCLSLGFNFVLAGYNAATDTLASGSLTLTFRDDTDPGPGAGGSHTESVEIVLDGVLTGNSPILITNGSPGFDTQFNVLTQLANGSLSVLLQLPAAGIGNNDFFFASARLIARGERADVPPPTTPEPASLLLFGAAALGFGMRRVRRSRG